MARGIIPITGLAVVVVLALAAVFGSISLANPAMAAIGQPADAELTERTFSPQADAATLTAVTGAEQVTLYWEFDGTDPAGWSHRHTVATNSFLSSEAGWSDYNDLAGDERMVTITGLSNGTEYVFELRGEDGTALQVHSASVRATPSPMPTNDVSDVEAEGSETGGVTLSWDYDAPTGDNDVQATSFQYRMRTACMDNSNPSDTDCSDYDDSGVSGANENQNPADVPGGDWSAWMTVAGGGSAEMAKIRLSSTLVAGMYYDFQVRSAAGSTGGNESPAIA